jgi:hypothetical protein
MLIDTSKLPSHVAMVARRLNVIGPDASGDTFLTVSYLAEVAIKTIAVVFLTALREGARDDAYRLGYRLARADSLGSWETVIRESTSQPLAGLVPPEFQGMVAWATKKRTKPDDGWFKDAKESADIIFGELGVGPEERATARTVRDLVTALVQIRNRTKAHGAVGPDFFSQANSPYITAVTTLILQCPAFSWSWMHVSLPQSGEPRIVSLRGENAQHISDPDLVGSVPRKSGVCFSPEQSPRAYSCADFLLSNRECTSFLLPNGSYNLQGYGEFIDYATGQTTREDLSSFLSPPAAPPASETEGMRFLDIQSSVFGNLPPVPKGYVERKGLQTELEERLVDRNHPIITLHGRGGVGKTSLALYVAHKIATSDDPHFEYIVWFSARDVDLRPTGPSPVRQAVADLGAVSKTYGRLFGIETSEEAFAKVLQQPVQNAKKGTLFIFDNFETMEAVRELHKFLDTHTHLPNKVVITSRERAFKADYPIEVRGLEFKEAHQMLRAVARELSIEGLVTEEVIRSVYEYMDGHAYVMRVALGEIAKEGRYVPPKQLMSKRMDIVNAVFERSFNKLGDAGRWVFLVVSNWRSAISELALIVVISQRGFDVEGGIEECTRFSLVARDYMADGQPCYSAPQLARVFGQKKLEGDPDRLVIQEDLETLRRFGVMGVHRIEQEKQEDLVRRFADWCMGQASSEDAERTGRLDNIMESVANLWPPGWSELAKFRISSGGDRADIEYALRRAVEEMPFSKVAWLERANYAQNVGDEATRVASLVSAVDADPSDLNLIRDVALGLCRYVNDHKMEIPKTRRGVYLASVRSHMERIADRLDATGLSRLAWLFLLEGKEDKAWEYAYAGRMREITNEHCLRILDRLMDQGYSPRKGFPLKK